MVVVVASSGSRPRRPLARDISDRFTTASKRVLTIVRDVSGRFLPPVVLRLLALPLFPTSLIPYALDGGITRGRHLMWLALTEDTTKIGSALINLVNCVIATSTLTFCVESLPEFRARSVMRMYGEPERAFALIEVICVSVFTADYLGRLLTLTASIPAPPIAFRMRKLGLVGTGKFMGVSYPSTGTQAWALLELNALRFTAFFLNPMNVIDLISIAPFYFEIAGYAVASGTSIVRIVRLARVLRLMRVARGLNGSEILYATLKRALPTLGYLSFILIVSMVLMASCVFFTEVGALDVPTSYWMRDNGGYNVKWPKGINITWDASLEPTPFLSIPDGMWWSLVTVGTVGYGDMVPKSGLGKLVGSLSLMIGILVLSLPVTVIGNSFGSELRRAQHLAEMKDSARRARAALKKASQGTASTSDSTTTDWAAESVTTEGSEYWDEESELSDFEEGELSSTSTATKLASPGAARPAAASPASHMPRSALKVPRAHTVITSYAQGLDQLEGLTQEYGRTLARLQVDLLRGPPEGETDE
jgi:hypothetical protein